MLRFALILEDLPSSILDRWVQLDDQVGFLMHYSRQLTTDSSLNLELNMINKIIIIIIMIVVLIIIIVIISIIIIIIIIIMIINVVSNASLMASMWPV